MTIYLFNFEKLKREEREVIKLYQQRHFKEEIMALHSGSYLKSSSKIFKLYLFLERDGILKVGGKIGKYGILDEIQYPNLSLGSCKTTELIIRWCHGKVAYAGQGITVNQIRSSDVWIISCNSLV